MSSPGPADVPPTDGSAPPPPPSQVTGSHEVRPLPAVAIWVVALVTGAVVGTMLFAIDSNSDRSGTVAYRHGEIIGLVGASTLVPAGVTHLIHPKRWWSLLILAAVIVAASLFNYFSH